MKTTIINEKEYPYMLTIWACKEFKNKFGINVTNVESNDVEQLQYLLYYGLQGGAKVNEEKFDLKIEVLDNFDITELCEKLLDVKEDENPKK